MEFDSVMPFWSIIIPVVSLIIYGTIIGLIFWLIHKKQKEKENKKKEEKDRYQQIYGKEKHENADKDLGKIVPTTLVVKKK